MKELKIPETRVLRGMFSEIQEEIDYINTRSVPYLMKKYGSGCLNTKLVLRVAELPSLMDAPRSQSGAVNLRYRNEISFNGRVAIINRQKFMERYFATDEGKTYKRFLESLDPGMRRQFDLF